MDLGDYHGRGLWLTIFLEVGIGLNVFTNLHQDVFLSQYHLNPKDKMRTITKHGVEYQCHHPWKDEWKLQFGGSDKSVYFFEAFPNPIFVRGESKDSVELAELDAWKQYEAIINCKEDHANPNNFDRKNYKNGLGFCRKCNIALKVFEPTEICCQCGAKNYDYKDKNGNWWCEDCNPKMPQELKSRWRIIMEEEEKEPISPEDEDFNNALREVITSLHEKFKAENP